MSRVAGTLNRVSGWDAECCLILNRASRRAAFRVFFAAVGRLGDGVFWYALMLSLLVRHGLPAVRPVIHMLLTGLACVLVYTWLKSRTLRPRPYRVHQGISLGARPLDEFSFPSGHTLHAVAFSVLASSYYPALGLPLSGFTLLVALSRCILGLHYPSDVLAGAGIGALIATVSLAL